DDFGFLAALPDHRERIARGAAGGGVIDDDGGHGYSIGLAGTGGFTALRAISWRKSPRESRAAASAPASWLETNKGTDPSAIPEKLPVNARARVTAGLAKLVDAVNQ